jgi:hypothetical protein
MLLRADLRAAKASFLVVKVPSHFIFLGAGENFALYLPLCLPIESFALFHRTSLCLSP